MASDNCRKDEHELLVGLRRGNYQAFDVLFDNHSRSVLNFLIHLGAKADEADEGAQEVFTRLWEKRETVRTDVNLRPFLLAIARNWWINESKSARRRTGALASEEDLPETGASPAENAEKRELGAAVRAAVERLPLDLREPFVQSRFHGLSYKEIGQVLGISHRTVEERVAQAYEKLRREMTRLSGEKRK
jgi:RNA polymerase sigma-70 factor (ECF subfamily)